MADPSEIELSARLAAGDSTAHADLFAKYRERIWRIVHFRLDPRMTSRVDADDVLQDLWMRATTRLSAYRDKGNTTAFWWFRELAGQALTDLYRTHVLARKRSAKRDVPLLGGMPMASSACLSAALVASQTSPSQAAIKQETASNLIEALEELQPIDREILMLRHFEELGNDEAAAILGLKPTAASNRYIRALERLQGVLEAVRREVAG